MMRSCWYVVIESLGAWWVDCEGKPFGPFDGLKAATAGAVRLAQGFADPTRQALVMAPDGRGKFHIVWENGAPKPV